MCPFFRRTLRMVMLVVISSMITGCIFGKSLSVTAIFNDDGTYRVFLSPPGTQTNCSEKPPFRNRLEFECNYTRNGSSETSDITLSGGKALTWLIVDPMVVQFPSNASNFAGSFLHIDTGINGNLVITEGLGSVRVDLDQTLRAEPGTQLVIIELPDDAPTEGNFAFNLNFTVPGETTSLSMKPMFTGRVVVDGEKFYPPLLPCVTDFADAPSITTPIPVPGDQVSIPPIAGLGCDNVTYNYGTAVTAGPASTTIPTLTQWGLILLLGLLGFTGIYYMKRRIH